MNITQAQLKQIIEEVLEEEESNWQEKDYTERTGDKSIKTSMHRGTGPDPFKTKVGEYQPAMEVGTKYSRTRETGKPTTVISRETFNTPGAAAKLEFTPWEGTVRTKGPADVEAKKTKFIQAPTTRYGQLDPTRQVSESQLKQMIEEEYTKMLQD